MPARSRFTDASFPVRRHPVPNQYRLCRQECAGLVTGEGRTEAPAEWRELATGTAQEIFRALDTPAEHEHIDYITDLNGRDALREFLADLLRG